jgi:hypothetical protein
MINTKIEYLKKILRLTGVKLERLSTIQNQLYGL